MNDEVKRLFFGLEVSAPWPESWPSGRLIEPSYRHLTLAFLGNIPFKPFQELLHDIPRPAFHVGGVGIFDGCLFLPHQKPTVIALHAAMLTQKQKILSYQKELSAWLSSRGYVTDEREFLPHVTLGRQPFVEKEWKDFFHPFSMMTGSLHLYESLGHLRYKPLWSDSIRMPFEEKEHTADLAFEIYGENLWQIFIHAQVALVFKYPPLLDFLEQGEVKSLDEAIIRLNKIIALCDEKIGCAFKAVSFHGDIKKHQEILSWEMIVDV